MTLLELYKNNINNPNNLFNPLWVIAKGSPELYLIILILYPMINGNFKSFMTSILLISSALLNYLIKNKIFKPIYKYTKTNELFLLGKGTRPENAYNCDSIFNTKVKKKSNTFGMPSGHSQLTWTITTFLILQILNIKKINLFNKKIIYFNNNNIKSSKKIICLLLIVFSILVSYSRVYIENCHTIQQVLIGSIIGIIYGYLINYIINFF